MATSGTGSADRSVDEETAALAAMADVVIWLDADDDGDVEPEDAERYFDPGAMDGIEPLWTTPERRLRMERDEYVVQMAELAIRDLHPELADRLAELRELITDHLDEEGL